MCSETSLPADSRFYQVDNISHHSLCSPCHFPSNGTEVKKPNDWFNDTQVQDSIDHMENGTQAVGGFWRAAVPFIACIAS